MFRTIRVYNGSRCSTCHVFLTRHVAVHPVPLCVGRQWCSSKEVCDLWSGVISAGSGRDLLTGRVVACSTSITATTCGISINCPTDNLFILCVVKPLWFPHLTGISSIMLFKIRLELDGIYGLKFTNVAGIFPQPSPELWCNDVLLLGSSVV